VGSQHPPQNWQQPTVDRPKGVISLTRELIPVIFPTLLLFSPSLLPATEEPSPVPAIAEPSAIPSDCGCVKKDKAPTSPGFRPDLLIGKPDRAPQGCCPPPYCKLVYPGGTLLVYLYRVWVGAPTDLYGFSMGFGDLTGEMKRLASEKATLTLTLRFRLGPHSGSSGTLPDPSTPAEPPAPSFSLDPARHRSIFVL